MNIQMSWGSVFWQMTLHQIHAAGGASSSTTMVMVFVVLFVLFVLSRLDIVIRCI
jgi:hypothetical protein